MKINLTDQFWNYVLAFGGLVLVAFTMAYAHYIAKNLEQRELDLVTLYRDSIESLIDNNNSEDETKLESHVTELVANNSKIPLILEDESGNLSGVNYGEARNSEVEFLSKRKDKILKTGYPPIEGKGYATYIYYENSRLYDLISYFPFVQFLLLSLFVTFAYAVFSASRRAEQNKVWAGMAKETAHQLGTPISALIGWTENLKFTEPNTDQKEIILELEEDIKRLDLIADRFSKIGSTPELEKTNLNELLNICCDYMEKRAPRNVQFTKSYKDDPLWTNVNVHLFNWVIENLIRNSLDAMGPKGEIRIETQIENQWATIYFSDSGKGIPVKLHNKIFRPGYSTKKRGWGLGLSLAKRIISEYHKGKIFIKNSKLNEGTTFAIKLPLA